MLQKTNLLYAVDFNGTGGQWPNRLASDKPYDTTYRPKSRTLKGFKQEYLDM